MLIIPIFDHAQVKWNGEEKVERDLFKAKIEIYLDRLKWDKTEKYEAYVVNPQNMALIPVSLKNIKGKLIIPNIDIRRFTEVIVGKKGRAKTEFFGLQ